MDREKLKLIVKNLKLLVESLEKSNEIDADRASKSLERAQERKIEQDSELNETRIDASLARALNRLRISKR